MATISAFAHGRRAAVGSWWDEYSGWVYVGVGAVVVYNCWGAFKAFGKLAEGAANATVGKWGDDIKDSGKKAKAKAATGNKIDFSDTDIAQFEQDVQALSDYFGRSPGLHATDLVKNQEDAFGVLKQRYSRLILYNNLPMHRVNGKLVSQKTATKDSLVRAYNWRVLAPFYLELTGHDLRGDIMMYITGSHKRKMLTDWIL